MSPYSFKLLAILVAFSITSLLHGQFEPQSINIDQFGEDAPLIDGDNSDALWSTIELTAIEIPFAEETVSFFKPATFKAAWNCDSIYFQLEVLDDNCYPTTDVSTFIYGASVMEETTSDYIGELDVSVLSPGYYIVEVNLGDKKVNRTILVE